MKKIFSAFLGTTMAAAIAFAGSPLSAAQRTFTGFSGPETSSSDVSDLRVPDPHKELRHLRKKLNLKKDQRTDVSVILEERAREIQLLLDVQSLSQEYRNALAEKVNADSDARIESLLKNKQKIKFDKELTRDHDLR